MRTERVVQLISTDFGVAQNNLDGLSQGLHLISTGLHLIHTTRFVPCYLTPCVYSLTSSHLMHRSLLTSTSIALLGALVGPVLAAIL